MEFWGTMAVHGAQVHYYIIYTIGYTLILYTYGRQVGFLYAKNPNSREVSMYLPDHHTPPYYY